VRLLPVVAAVAAVGVVCLIAAVQAVLDVTLVFVYVVSPYELSQLNSLPAQVPSVAHTQQSAPARGRSGLGVAPGAGAAIATRGHTTKSAHGMGQADDKFEFILIFRDVL
jgi:hypothetical protein